MGSFVAFAIIQPGVADVATACNHRISVQHSLVEYDDLIVGLQMVTESLIEYHLEIAIIRRICHDRVVLLGNQSAMFIGYTGDNVSDLCDLIKGEAGCGFVVKHIVLSTGVHGDGGAEVDNLADVSGVVGAPVVCGVFLNLLVHSGSTVFCIDGCVGVGGGQATQGADSRVYQVVTQGQACELTACAGNGEFVLICRGFYRIDAIILCVSQRLLGKSRHDVVTFTSDPGNVAGVVHCNISQSLGGFEKLFPAGADGVGIHLGGGIVAFQMKQLIDCISIGSTNAVDGDRAGGVDHTVCNVFCLCFRFFSKRCRCQRQDHNQGHHNSKQFFHGIYFLSVITYVFRKSRRNYRNQKAQFVLLSRLRLDPIPYASEQSIIPAPQSTYISRAAEPVAGSSGPPAW